MGEKGMKNLKKNLSIKIFHTISSTNNFIYERQVTVALQNNSYLGFRTMNFLKLI